MNDYDDDYDDDKSNNDDNGGTLWLRLPSGEAFALTGGMPGDNLEIDGEATPLQFGSSIPAGDSAAALVAAIDWLGPDTYGREDGDRERTIAFAISAWKES